MRGTMGSPDRGQSLEGDYRREPGSYWVPSDNGFPRVCLGEQTGWLVTDFGLVITVGQWWESIAGVVQWQNGSLPSFSRRFDSARPLQLPRRRSADVVRGESKGGLPHDQGDEPVARHDHAGRVADPESRGAGRRAPIPLARSKLRRW